MSEDQKTAALAAADRYFEQMEAETLRVQGVRRSKRNPLMPLFYADGYLEGLAAGASALDELREELRAIKDDRDSHQRVAQRTMVERDVARNDTDAALATVGAFRQAIEEVWSKSAGESGEDGFIVSYVVPVGVLHRAIGLARGTDAGGHLLKELREAKAVASDATVTVILQDLMDMPQDDPEHDDAIIVTYDHLLIVLNRAILGIE